MKILSLFLFLFLTISCKEEENSLENILLSNLKETSDYHEKTSNEALIVCLIKSEEQGRSNVKLKQISTNSKKIGAVFNEIKNKSKEFQIEEFVKIINRVNVNSKTKFKNLDLKTLENLSNKTSYYFIKNEYYKNLLQIVLEYSRKNFPVTYCGTTIYDEEEKYILMDKLKRLRVQEFKDSICNSNMR